MNSNDLLKQVKKAGWYKVRQNGSHVILKHDSIKDTISIPDHGKDELGKGLVNKILKQAGLL